MTRTFLAMLVIFTVPVFAGSFTFNNFSSTADLTLVGDAAGFTSNFQFQITEKGGYSPDWSLVPGSGGAAPNRVEHCDGAAIHGPINHSTPEVRRSSGAASRTSP